MITTRRCASLPRMPTFNNNRGWAFFKKGNLDSGDPDITKALSLNPDLAKAYANRGWIHKSVGECQKRCARLQSALELEPTPQLFTLSGLSACFEIEATQPSCQGPGASVRYGSGEPETLLTWGPSKSCPATMTRQ